MAPPLPDNLWFPVAAGIADLPEAPATSTAAPVPANAITTPTGFDAANPDSIWTLLPTGEDPVFAATISPASLVPVVVEEVKAVALVRLRLLARSFPYALSAAVQQLVVSIAVQISAVRVKLLGAAGAITAVTGQATTLRYTRAIKAAAGSLATTGVGAGSIRDYRIGTNFGTFTATGQNAIVALQRAPLAAGAGSFALSGQAALFSGATTFPADAGSFAVTGQAAGSIRSYLLGGAAGALNLSGQHAGLGLSDPNFSSVSLLLHMDGTNGSTSITDNSANAFTVTAVGNAQISTAQSKFGGASCLFDGSGDYLSVPDSSAFDLAGDDFTIEAWVRFASNSSVMTIASQRKTLTLDYGWAFEWNNLNNGPTFRYSTSGTSLTASKAVTFAISTATWYHFAVVRSGTNLKFFVDGVKRGADQAISTAVFYNSTAPVLVGAASSNSPTSFMNGNIDDLRITKGVARYTANFTPPSQAFPDF